MKKIIFVLLLWVVIFAGKHRGVKGVEPIVFEYQAIEVEESGNTPTMKKHYYRSDTFTAKDGKHKRKYIVPLQKVKDFKEQK
jgi:hypothetical protein